MPEEGNKVVLQGEYLWVRDNQGKLLMKVKHTASILYKIRIVDSGSVEESGCDPVCLLSKVERDSWLWHSRLTI